MSVPQNVFILSEKKKLNVGMKTTAMGALEFGKGIGVKESGLGIHAAGDLLSSFNNMSIRNKEPTMENVVKTSDSLMQLFEKLTNDAKLREMSSIERDKISLERENNQLNRERELLEREKNLVIREMNLMKERRQLEGDKERFYKEQLELAGKRPRNQTEEDESEAKKYDGSKKVQCSDCGSIFRLSDKVKHLTTTKHKNAVKSLTNQNQNL